MCDAEYIDKKKLKVITFEKLLKKWDNTHYKKTFSPYINEWKWECNETNEEKYKNKILFMLDHKLGDGKKLIRNKLIKLYTNELNKVKAIRKSSDYANWDCWIEENIGVFAYENVLEMGGYYTFTEIKKKLKKIIVDMVDKFMEEDHKRIAAILSDRYGDYIDIRFRIVYTVIKEEQNGYDSDTEIKFTPDIFC